MKKLKLKAEKLVVESFETFTTPEASDTVPQREGCICFAPPCGCTAGPDCTTV
ncbi:MAG TPA: hypothetical protein VHG08_19030 [Longimicrobium sp.]|nr:hypothetical protein [Longimicrobium sp.]